MTPRSVVLVVVLSSTVLLSQTAGFAPSRPAASLIRPKAKADDGDVDFVNRVADAASQPVGETFAAGSLAVLGASATLLSLSSWIVFTICFSVFRYLGRRYVDEDEELDTYGDAIADTEIGDPIVEFLALGAAILVTGIVGPTGAIGPDWAAPPLGIAMRAGIFAVSVLPLVVGLLKAKSTSSGGSGIGSLLVDESISPQRRIMELWDRQMDEAIRAKQEKNSK